MEGILGKVPLDRNLADRKVWFKVSYGPSCLTMQCFQTNWQKLFNVLVVEVIFSL